MIESKTWKPGLTIRSYAELWEDMAPHVDTLFDMACRCRRILELGVRGGVSSWAFLQGLPMNGELYSFDVDENVHDMVPPAVRDDHRWHLSIMDSKAFFPAVDAFDLVLIDTSHTYADTIVELRHMLLAAPVIVLHDYLAEDYPGVHEAVHEVMREGGLELTVYPSKWGLAVLTRGQNVPHTG